MAGYLGHHEGMLAVQLSRVVHRAKGLQEPRPQEPLLVRGDAEAGPGSPVLVDAVLEEDDGQ